MRLPFAIPRAFEPIGDSHPDPPEYFFALNKQLGETMADVFTHYIRPG